MMKNQLCLICLATLLAFSALVKADTIGIKAGIGVWNSDLSGHAVHDVDVSGELGIVDDTAYSVYLAFEHPVPLVPNIRLARTSIDRTDQGKSAHGFSFAGDFFAVDETIRSTLDLSFTDLTLYYEFLDTGFELDAGLTIRKFDGELRIDQTRDSIDGYVPLAYVSGKVGLPFSGFYVAADIHTAPLGSVDVADYNARLGWETSAVIVPELGIEAGYRRFDLDAGSSDLDVNLDTTVSGPFLNLVIHF